MKDALAQWCVNFCLEAPIMLPQGLIHANCAPLLFQRFFSSLTEKRRHAMKHLESGTDNSSSRVTYRDTVVAGHYGTTYKALLAT